MTEKKKVPGMVSDPWRAPTIVKKPTGAYRTPEPMAEDLPLHVRTISTDDSPIKGDIQSLKYATIELKGYGGITVDGVVQMNHAAAQLLQFCVDHHKAIDDICVRYGVLVAQVPVTEMKLPYYIQRADGWLLAVPEAKTRDEGCLQLIQAMLEVYQNPKLQARMRKYRIRPYKM